MRRKRYRVHVSNEQIDAAIERAKRFEAHDPRVVHARYDPDEDFVTLDFADRARLSIPRNQLQGLETASRSQLSKIEIIGNGTGLHWPLLDVDHYVLGLLEHRFGTKRWMKRIGRMGGLVKSKAKSDAARLNGSKGGRPRLNAAQNT
jgi:hypothetical protein